MFYKTLLLLVITYWFCKKKLYRWIYIILKTLKRDIKALTRFAKFNIRMYKLRNRSVTKVFGDLVTKHPNKVAFLCENESWTYKQVDEYSNKIGTYFKNKGYRQGDTVALLINGKPEYVGIWMGLSKIGVVTALINTNLTKDPLVHSIKVANAKALIFGSDFFSVVSDIASSLEQLELYYFNENSQISEEPQNLKDSLPNEMIHRNIADLSKELEESRAENLESLNIKEDPSQKLLYIFTSGTTGLPKAAIITNSRFLLLAHGTNVMVDINDNDIIYDSLPLYHTAGGIVGVGQSIVCGSTVAIRKKFSARNFWKDCKKYNCTVAQYIGEICRYLLAVPSSKDTENQTVKTMVGNGLKPQIWNQFVNRFKIKNLYELYGSTEGNSNLINLDNKPGAVGFIPRYAGAIYPIVLVKCDNQGEPIRNANGLCEKCDVEEAGVLIGKIDPKRALNNFTGYADSKATDKKIIQNVFKKGDCYFNSGDILVQDELGYYYFKDRTGDTFRWKGENVSTSEVEAIVSNVVNLSDAVVYGVEVPNTEGRAGMAAIVDTDAVVDVDRLATQLRQNLPAYAIPIFLRLMDSVPLTGTFKLKKVDLQNEGFDIKKITDRLFVYDSKTWRYKAINEEVYNEIVSGALRL